MQSNGRPTKAPRIPRAAIRDVATVAGVSIATVSRVLNGRPDVAPATRESVMRHARDLGYRSNRNAPVIGDAGTGMRNPSARIVARAPTGLVGMVVPLAQNAYCAGIIEGASEAVYERDAHLVLCPTHFRRDREISLLHHLAHGATDGSLLVLPLESMAELCQLQQRGSPFVVIDPTTPLDANVPVVAAANWAGARKATEHLINLGHTRIGVIIGHRTWCSSIDRLAGYHSALLAAGLPIVPEYLREADFWIDEGQRAAHELLALPNRPTAIFAMSDAMAVGTLVAARDRGLEVPADLSVVGFDDIDMAFVVSPALTTVRQPLHEMGRLAVTILYRQIHGQPLDANRVELSTRLVVRNSTAPPR